MTNGWIKVWQKMWKNPNLRGRPNHIVIWLWILTNASWNDERQVRFHGKIIKLRPGQLTCGSLQMSEETGVSQSTAKRIVRELADEQLIEQRTDFRCSLITVKNWSRYQEKMNSQSDSQSTAERTAVVQPMATNIRREDVKKKESKTYVCRPETESFYKLIDDLCQKYQIENKIHKKALDVLVERYLGKFPLAPEAQHCISWLIEHGHKMISTARLGNWFKTAQKIQRRDQLKLLERKQAYNDPHLKQQLAKRNEKPEQPAIFKIDDGVKTKLRSLTNT